MGLMLSILISCVGIIELLTFYNNVSRHLTDLPQRGDLSVIKNRYSSELSRIPRRPGEIFDPSDDKSDNALILNREDIEIEFDKKLEKSRSPSPRKFLLTEKEDIEKDRRKFIASEPPFNLTYSKSQISVPEFLLTEDTDNLNQTRYFLQEKQTDDSTSNLPRQFLVTEDTLNTLVFEESDFEVPPPIIVPRNSTCSELEETEPLKSLVPIQIGEKIDVILESTNFNTTQYWTNRVLVAPSNFRSKSTSPDRIKCDEKFLNDLDGTSKAKNIKRFSTTRRSIKKKNSETHLNPLKKQPTEEVLKYAAEELKKVSKKEEASTSETNKEPFWLIFSGEYAKAMNKEWHAQHFCCWQCDESLTGQRYVLRDEHPYCVSCYESVFANACEKCSRIIGIDSKDLSYKDKHWHEACFLCTTCGESLVDKQFGSKGDRIYCGNCYDQQFASRCDGCHEIFRAGTKKMEYKTRQWHEKCFCCCVCKVPIGTQSFIPREQEIYCAKCYEEKFATRCTKCNKVITSGGVTYKNEPWHRECFTCTHCTRSLAGERFTSRDDKPYCAECFGELFAKRCTACSKPITGIGGTKFISFEDRHWHNDCFFCASCKTSLVGRGFITDQDDIICPDCAKAKLM